MDNINFSYSQQFIKVALHYSTKRSNQWGLSNRMQEKICSNKILNDFVKSLLNQADQFSEENARQYFKALEKDSSDYYTVRELLGALKEKSFVNIKMEALQTNVMLLLHSRLAALNGVMLKLCEETKGPLTDSTLPEPLKALLKERISIGEDEIIEKWTQDINEQKNNVLNHLKYPAVTTNIREIVWRYLLTLMPHQIRNTVTDSFRNKGHSPAFNELIKYCAEKKESPILKKAEILMKLVEGFYTKEKLLALLEKDDTLVQTMLNENSLKQLIKANITKEDVRVRRYIDVFLTVKYEKLRANASDTTQQPSEEIPEAGPSTPRPYVR